MQGSNWPKRSVAPAASYGVWATPLYLSYISSSPVSKRLPNLTSLYQSEMMPNGTSVARKMATDLRTQGSRAASATALTSCCHSTRRRDICHLDQAGNDLAGMDSIEQAGGSLLDHEVDEGGDGEHGGLPGQGSRPQA